MTHKEQRREENKKLRTFIEQYFQQFPDNAESDMRNVLRHLRGKYGDKMWQDTTS